MKRPDSARENVNLRGRTNLSEGYAALFATIVIWSTPSLFQYYLNRYYDPWAQNFYRYLVACLAIAPLLIYRTRRSAPWLNWRVALICLIPFLPNVIHQITQVIALFYMGPGVFPRGAPRHSSMAVPIGHSSWVNWRFRCRLVSTGMGVKSHCAARIVYR